MLLQHLKRNILILFLIFHVATCGGLAELQLGHHKEHFVVIILSVTTGVLFLTAIIVFYRYWRSKYEPFAVIVGPSWTGTHRYLVLIDTGYFNGGRKNVEVSLQLIGTHGNSDCFTIPRRCSFRRNFSSGQRDRIIIYQNNNIGELKEINVILESKARKGSWFIQNIRVAEVGRDDKRWRLLGGRWLKVKENSITSFTFPVLYGEEGRLDRIRRQWIELHLTASLFFSDTNRWGNFSPFNRLVVQISLLSNIILVFYLTRNIANISISSAQFTVFSCCVYVLLAVLTALLSWVCEFLLRNSAELIEPVRRVELTASALALLKRGAGDVKSPSKMRKEEQQSTRAKSDADVEKAHHRTVTIGKETAPRGATTAPNLRSTPATKRLLDEHGEPAARAKNTTITSLNLPHLPRNCGPPSRIPRLAPGFGKNGKQKMVETWLGFFGNWRAMENRFAVAMLDLYSILDAREFPNQRTEGSMSELFLYLSHLAKVCGIPLYKYPDHDRGMLNQRFDGKGSEAAGGKRSSAHVNDFDREFETIARTYVITVMVLLMDQLTILCVPHVIPYRYQAACSSLNELVYRFLRQVIVLHNERRLGHRKLSKSNYELRDSDRDVVHFMFSDDPACRSQASSILSQYGWYGFEEGPRRSAMTNNVGSLIRSKPTDNEDLGSFRPHQIEKCAVSISDEIISGVRRMSSCHGNVLIFFNLLKYGPEMNCSWEKTCSNFLTFLSRNVIGNLVHDSYDFVNRTQNVSLYDHLVGYVDSVIETAVKGAHEKLTNPNVPAATNVDERSQSPAGDMLLPAIKSLENCVVAYSKAPQFYSLVDDDDKELQEKCLVLVQLTLGQLTLRQLVGPNALALMVGHVSLHAPSLQFLLTCATPIVKELEQMSLELKDVRHEKAEQMSELVKQWQDIEFMCKGASGHFNAMFAEHLLTPSSLQLNANAYERAQRGCVSNPVEILSYHVAVPSVPKNEKHALVRYCSRTYREELFYDAEHERDDDALLRRAENVALYSDSTIPNTVRKYVLIILVFLFVSTIVTAIVFTRKMPSADHAALVWYFVGFIIADFFFFQFLKMMFIY